ncbi:MAG: lasso peptide biosynthesis B2 protein [Bacteroidales bacterium]
MFKLFRKYIKLRKQERKILNQTFFWLIFATVLARLTPLRWFNHLLGEFKKEDLTELESTQIEIVQQFKKNLRRWKRYLPWRIKCFEEAITAKKVLEKYKIKTTLYLGVDKNDKKELTAHAWIKAGSKMITGEKGYERYVVVGFYS